MMTPAVDKIEVGSKARTKKKTQKQMSLLLVADTNCCKQTSMQAPTKPADTIFSVVENRSSSPSFHTVTW